MDITDLAKPPRRGKPAFQPTDEQRKNVKILVALGIPERAICAIVRDHRDRPISENTPQGFRTVVDQPSRERA